MTVFKVSCNNGKDKGASTKAEWGDYFITSEGPWVAKDFHKTFQETPLGLLEC